MADKHIDYSDIPELTAQDFKRARRVTPAEVAEATKALDKKFGKDRPRLKPGPKPHPENRYIPIYIKLHPQAIAWARLRAKRKHIGYQTVINQTLLNYAKTEGK